MNYTGASSFEGCLLGLMLGDCVGLPREGLTPKKARKMFGAEIRQQFIFGRGMMSDDTEHACMTAQALLASCDDPSAFATALAWKLRFWLLGLPAGVGWATLRSIVKLWIGFGPQASGVMSAGNGAAMRAPILGLFFDDAARRREFTAASTRLTHRDPRAERGALAVAQAAHYAASSSRASFSASELLAQLMELFPKEDAEARHGLAIARRGVDEVWDGERFSRELGRKDGVSGYIYQTLPAVLWAWLGTPFDFRATLTRVIALGGDTDTTGAIAGALCGAAVGAEAIPADWLDGVWEFPRNVAWVKALARRLAAKKGGARAAPLPLCWPAIIARNILFMICVLLHGSARIFVWNPE